ncbi:MAG TPA: ABC transporter ATP-binding protein [Methylomirabilota bacterium]|nr:ABC transporter ATP-binding protein [Methylomirabilota bacterium]
MSVALERLTKVFPDPREPGLEIRAVDDVSLEVKTGELVTLLGPSGCGKTTALRMVAGFEPPTAGEVRIDGQVVTHEPPHVRNTAMVFQSYAIFPHLSVAENVAFGLEMRRVAAAEIARRVRAMLDLVELGGFGGRRPDQLSGGQQQRVALARALITEPKVLLFDEPLSNLDAKLRAEMRGQIRAIQRRVGLTSIYVTHDQAEAMALSDRIVVMHAGRIEQVGPPAEIYGRPATRFVADFLGRVNFLEAEPAETGRARLRLGAGLVPVVVDGDATGPGPWLAVLRPEALALEPAEGAGPDRPRARVRRTVFLGSVAEYEVEVDGAALLVSVANPLETGLFAEGDVVALRLTARSLVLVRGNAR